MFHRQSLLHASIHAAAFTIGYGLGYFLFEKASFGLLTAWWLSLYVGFITNVRIPAAAPIGVLYVSVLAADIFLDRGWFYAEGASASPAAYFAISLAYGLVILVSPLFLNALVRHFFQSNLNG